MTALPIGVCVRVSELRKRGISDLRAYMADADNELVCRRGRVFITTAGRTEVFAYPASEWANPAVVVGSCTLEEALRKYRVHLDAMLGDPARLERFKLLASKRTLGCYCQPGAPCHRDLIIAKLRAITTVNGGGGGGGGAGDESDTTSEPLKLC